MGNGRYLLVGLGNPGERYAGTRHNIGFEVVDAVMDFDEARYVEKGEALSATIHFAGVDLCILKPMTYMNLSGQAVRRYVDFFKIPSEHILIVHDDLDMAVGRLKLVKGGGSGGHNGIRSLLASLGKGDFFRLKIGIGKPGSCDSPEDMPVDKYVLASFGPRERKIVDQRIPEIVSGLTLLYRQGAQAAMNFLNCYK